MAPILLGPWGWVILGLVLIGGEVLAPGIFLLWLGLAALLTGAVVGLVDLGWQSEQAGEAVRNGMTAAIQRVREAFEADLQAKTNDALDRGYLNDAKTLLDEIYSLARGAQSLRRYRSLRPNARPSPSGLTSCPSPAPCAGRGRRTSRPANGCCATGITWTRAPRPRGRAPRSR